eukprot:scaffold89073_cov43-Phaeocystis_antarctica.AAC.3
MATARRARAGAPGSSVRIARSSKHRAPAAPRSPTAPSACMRGACEAHGAWCLNARRMACSARAVHE